MDHKKKSSTLRTSSKDEDQTTGGDMRLKRRISFSEKKSVREFSKEQQPKKWENSYELSDHCDSTNNSKNTSSGEIKVNSTSGLCTTSEFIDKSNQDELIIEQSLGITLSEYELENIKHHKHLTAKTGNEMKSNINQEIFAEKMNCPRTTENAVTNDFQIKTLATQSHSLEHSRSTSTDVKLVCLDENSNKENISPETLEIFETEKTTKTPNEEQSPTNMDYDTSDDFRFKNTKSPKAIVQNNCVPEEMEITQNVSGIYPIEFSASFSMNNSTSCFDSPLIPSHMLPKGSKKIDFQQLNEDIANGRLKLFPNIEKCSSVPVKRSPFPSQRKRNRMDITNQNLKNLDDNTEKENNRTHYTQIDLEKTSSYSKGAIPKERLNDETLSLEKENRAHYTDIDVEKTPTSYSKGAIPKKQLNNRTLYKQLNVESTYFNDPKDAVQCTLIDCIDNENHNIANGALTERTEEEPHCNFANKTEKIIIDKEEQATPTNLVNSSGNILKRRTIIFEDAVLEEELQPHQKNLTLESSKNFIDAQDKANDECLKKSHETRKTTYSITNIICEQQNNPNTMEFDNVVNIEPLRNMHKQIIDQDNAEKRVQYIKNFENDFMKTKENSIVEQYCSPFVENPTTALYSGNKNTYMFNDTNKITENDQVYNNPGSINKIAYKKYLQSRRTHLFDNSDALITSMEDLDQEHIQKHLENSNYENPTKRKTIHFENDDQMDLTKQGIDEQLENVIETQNEQLNFNRTSDFAPNKNNKILPFLYPPLQTPIQNNETNNEVNMETTQQNKILPFSHNICSTESLKETSIQDIDTTNEINTQFISKIPKSHRKTVMFSSTIGAIEIESTPLRPIIEDSLARFNAFSPATPHRSVLEFEQLEEEIMQEDENSSQNACKKRTTSNLTPNLPMSKKRQSMLTGLFENSQNNSNDIAVQIPDMEMGMDVNNLNVNNSKWQNCEMDVNSSRADISKEEDCSFKQGLKCFNYEREENITEQDQAEQIEINENISIDKTFNPTQTINETLTPSFKATHISNIPIYIGSGRKKSISCVSSQQTTPITRFIDGNENRYSQMNFFTPNKINLSKEQIQRISIFECEDKPITISDVSQHFSSQRQRETINANRRSCEIEYKTDKLVESINDIIESDDIDKTKLELVQSYLDETEGFEDLEDIEEQDNQNDTENGCQMFKFQNKIEEDINALQQQQQPQQHPDELGVLETKRNSLLCQKCKRCQQSFLNESASTENGESFVMPSLPSIDEITEKWCKKVEKYRKGPTLEMAAKLYQRLKLQSSMESLNTTVDEEIVKKDTNKKTFVQEMREKSERIDREYYAQVAQLSKSVTVIKSFVSRLKDLMSKSEVKNWIMNARMIHRQVLRFRHREIYTFCIILQYEKEDIFGDNVVITHISMENSSVPCRTWTPFAFITHFQLQLELPFNIRSYCDGNSEFNVYEMLLKIDEICKNVLQMTKELWRIVNENVGRLIRENGESAVEKVMRKIIYDEDGSYKCTEKTVFRIEIADIKKMCFKNIIRPPVYMFRDDIENLPSGLNFLRVFLQNPASFLKNSI